MDYISTKDAAARFGLSERRVQKLCETGRIENCRMVSGVWIIPADATKPNDDRLSVMPENKNCISLKELCEELSISTATGRNWIKLEKITPQYTEKGTPYFSRSYVSQLKRNIKNGSNRTLKSGRNKKYVSGSGIYNSYVSAQCKNVDKIKYLLQIINQNHMKLDSDKLQLLLADCAVKLFASKDLIKFTDPSLILLRYLSGEISFGAIDRLIDDLINDKNAAVVWISDNTQLFQTNYIYEPREDIIGLLYISFINLGTRKATGSYYTPTSVVRKLIHKLTEKNGTAKTILDPCCGTGNFLIQLPDKFSLDQIFGNDIDPISVKVARINMALRFNNADVNIIYNNITALNYLTDYEDITFDLIIGNPPWGYSFSKDETDLLKKKFTSAAGKNIESYDVFIEQALSNLKSGGVLSFILPEAVLHVKAHMPIRKIIAQNNSIQYIEYLGNAFDKVQCPCLILQLKHTQKNLSCIGMEVNDSSKTFRLNVERKIEPAYFNFALTDEEYKIIENLNSLPNVSYLKNNAAFALGIVTGDNQKYISNVKTDENERILKGSDLRKYRINDSGNYIIFKPENFQQIAPTEYYRAPEKLLYRFICNQLIFAYDNKQTLSLNSCNILIPQIEGVEIKYVLAILNSRIAQFIYKKQFHSVKVLRSHIEQIPIPIVSSDEQQIVIEYVNRLLLPMPEKEMDSIYDQLDTRIRTLYHLNDFEYQIIQNAIDDENKFIV